MFIMSSFKKSLIVEQFQGNYLKQIFIEKGGGGGGLVQIRGGSPFFMQKFKEGPQENMQMYKPIKC